MTRLNTDKAILMMAFARMDPVALAVALGTLLALMLYAATAVLLIKGGEDVGSHLALISIYLPGYEVSWAGAAIGFAYLWVLGAILGMILAVLWNLAHYLYVALIVVRAAWWKMMAD